MKLKKFMQNFFIKFISKSLKILSNKKDVLFNNDYIMRKDYYDISRTLFHNSSNFYLILYFLNSCLIYIINNFPLRASNFLFKKLINPRINPISKVYLFLIYHDGFN